MNTDINKLDSGHGNLVDHLLSVGRSIREISESNSKYRYVGYLHDIAKVSNDFQNYLKESKEGNKTHTKFRHPVAALPIAYHVLEKAGFSKDEILLGSMAIYFHHSKISLNMIQNDILSGDLRGLTPDEIHLAREVLNIVSKKTGDPIDTNFNFASEKEYVSRMIEILRMIYKEFSTTFDNKSKSIFSEIYSLLVEADWKSSGSSKHFDFDELYNRFIKIYDTKFRADPKDPKVLEQVKVKREVFNKLDNISEMIDKRVSFLVAPTGSGKTEASLNWGLKRARKIGARRFIYVLPFNSLIEDMFNRMAGDDGYFDKDTVSVWNSNYLSVLPLDNITNYRQFNLVTAEYRHFVKTPIILTTADQILMSFFNVGRYAIRRGIFRESVFVFDEIQGYSPKLRIYIYLFIEQLIKEGAHVLIMTATKPVEFNNSYVSGDLIRDSEIEFITDDNWFKTMAEARNVEIRSINDSDLLSLFDNYNEIPEKGKGSKKVPDLNIRDYSKISVIVNTIKRAKDVYGKIKKSLDKANSDYEVFLLHSEMTSLDKSDILSKIQNSEKVIVVSTQVLEAGIDFSFDLMFRDLAPLDSMVQALGRVNRYGDHENARFYINDILSSNDKSKYYPYGESELKSVKKLIFNEDMLKNEISAKYSFEQLLSERQSNLIEFKKSLYDSRFMVEITSSILWSTYSVKQLLGEELRDALLKVDILVDDGHLFEKISSLKYKDIEEDFHRWIKLMRRISSSIVSIKRYDYDKIKDKLCDDGKTKLISREDYLKLVGLQSD